MSETGGMMMPAVTDSTEQHLLLLFVVVVFMWVFFSCITSYLNYVFHNSAFHFSTLYV